MCEAHHWKTKHQRLLRRSEFGCECSITTLPLYKVWDAHVSMTEILPSYMNLLELLPGKGGTEKEKRCSYTVPALCPMTQRSGELQWRTAVQDCIS